MEAKGAAPPAERLTASAGSVEIPIYSRTREVGGREYLEHTIAYYDAGGKRVRRTFADLAEAKKEGKRIATALSRGQHAAASLTATDVAHLQWAKGALAPTGMSIPGALTELLEAKAKLPDGFTLNYVIEDFVRRNPVGLVAKKVSEIVDEFQADLERRGLSEVYLLNQEKLGRQFSKAFDCPLASVNPDIFKEWLWKLRKLDGKAPSGRTLKNTQRGFSLLVGFAVRRKYVSRELAREFSEMESPKAGAPSCEVFSVDAYRRLLHAAGPDTLAAFVLGGMAGIRTAEIQRLTWSDIDLAEQVVKIAAHAAKTQSRRVVPLCDAAVAWLSSVHLKKGPVLPVDPKEMVMAGVRADVKWVKNGLRHGYASARLAVVHDAAKVAFEMGNSPAMIQAHYRSLMTEGTGKAWFAIRPSRGECGEILQMTQFPSARSRGGGADGNHEEPKEQVDRQ